MGYMWINYKKFWEHKSRKFDRMVVWAIFLSGNSNIKQYVNYFKTYCDSRASIGVSAELNKIILALY